MLKNILFDIVLIKFLDNSTYNSLRKQNYEYIYIPYVLSLKKMKLLLIMRWRNEMWNWSQLGWISAPKASWSIDNTGN